MLDKDPFSYGVLTYLWVLGLAAWGGAVSFMRKMRMGEVRAFNFTEFVGEIATSAFVGILTFWLCESAGFSQLFTAACVGVSGHMGSRGIFMFERYLSNRFGVQVTPEDK